jgi:hypothetical protein
MAESPATTPGRIFISYRREETAYAAGWLFDRLTTVFGGDQVFKDVDSIDLGDDFVEVISTAVGSADVLLALIGDQWLTIADERGTRRLDDPHDFVRVEVEAALARMVRVIPILVDGARMPRADELPPKLASLARRQALELSPSRFEFDTSRLLRVLEKTLAEMRTTQGPAASMSAPAGAGPDPSMTDGPRKGRQRDRSRRQAAPRTTERSTAQRDVSGSGERGTETSKAPFPARWLAIATVVLFAVGVAFFNGKANAGAAVTWILFAIALIWTPIQAARIHFHKRRST